MISRCTYSFNIGSPWNDTFQSKCIISSAFRTSMIKTSETPSTFLHHRRRETGRSSQNKIFQGHVGQSEVLKILPNYHFNVKVFLRKQCINRNANCICVCTCNVHHLWERVTLRWRYSLKHEISFSGEQCRVERVGVGELGDRSCYFLINNLLFLSQAHKMCSIHPFWPVSAANFCRY